MKLLATHEKYIDIPNGSATGIGKKHNQKQKWFHQNTLEVEFNDFRVVSWAGSFSIVAHVLPKNDQQETFPESNCRWWNINECRLAQQQSGLSLSLDGPQSDKQVMLINHDKSKNTKPNMSYTVQFAQNEQTIRIRNTTNYIYYDIMMMNIID